MSDLDIQALSPALQGIGTRPLFVARFEVRGPVVVGATPGGDRRVGIITGGRFEGERLRGRALDGGSDWQTVRGDGTWTLNVRVVLETDDGALIGMTYGGLRHGPADVLAKIGRGEAVDPASYYFRINPMFETASPAYGWMNNLVAIGTGHREATGPVYSVFEVL